MRFVTALVLALVTAAACAMSADATALNTIQRGYYKADDSFDPTNDNYITGQIIGDQEHGTTSYHDFFSFDLSGVSGTITSATLRLYEPGPNDAGPGFGSPQATETLQIYVYGGDVAALNAGGTVPGAHTGLVSGTLVGTFVVSAANDGSFIDVILSDSAIAALNAASGQLFAFGGDLLDVPDGGAFDRYVFAFTGNTIANPGDGLTQLILTVPEPSSLMLFAAALTGLGLVRRGSTRKDVRRRI